jgi:hypothetical protein
MDLAYKDCKACIVQKDDKGEHISTFTTWRGDIISGLIEKAMLGTNFKMGNRLHIEIVPADMEFEHISDEEMGW